MKISVIVPSRLQVNPMSPGRNLYVDNALTSVQRQSVYADHQWEFVVGTDPSAPPLATFATPCQCCPGGRYGNVVQAWADVAGQAAAVNAAVRASTGDVLAFLEDDDTWEPRKMERQLRPLCMYELVTCNQREVAEDRCTWLRTNDFPTPSGWVMLRTTWDRLGGMDETFRYHVDTQFLGKANAAKVSRAHLVEADADKTDNQQRLWWLSAVSSHSVIIETPEREPLVTRTVTSTGGMASIAGDPKAKRISMDEHERMVAQFGKVPW
jgi:glycosyltransferase involved in cell wall biosynthesis